MIPSSLRLRFLQAFHRNNISRTFFAMLALALFPASLTAGTLLVATGSGEGEPPLVRLFIHNEQGKTETISIQPYSTGFRGGVRVAVGDVNGDTVPDVITAPGPGMEPRIRVFDSSTGKPLTGRIGGFLALSGFFRTGLFVAAGDVNGDHKDDIIVAPDAGMLPIVRVFDGN